MAILRLPASVVSVPSGVVWVGGGSAIGDESDATYLSAITGSFGGAVVTFPPASLPSGLVTVNVTMEWRAAMVAHGVNVAVEGLTGILWEAPAIGENAPTQDYQRLKIISTGSSQYADIVAGSTFNLYWNDDSPILSGRNHILYELWMEIEYEGAAVQPPCRLYPRTDSLRNTPRIFPRPDTRQASPRISGHL